jgi:8-oxo-dGTP pyrophosphatase MutT (NUDIX family)
MPMFRTFRCPRRWFAVWSGDGRLLLVFDRRRQSWELPAGRIEAGETARQAAQR